MPVLNALVQLFPNCPQMCVITYTNLFLSNAHTQAIGQKIVLKVRLSMKSTV